MKKIVELKIDIDNEDFDGLGVDIMSLVNQPAIGIDWMAFSDEDCVECFDLDEACKPGYEAIGMKPKGGRMVPNCVPIENSEEEFASYSDYPDSVKNNAKRGIKLNEAVNNKCATQVGKVRAQQLAKGEAISEETIKRMFSYLSRAEVYYESGDTESCGYISYLLWGGKSAKTWAESKLNQIERDKMYELAASDEFGEYYDEDTIYIDGTKENFENIGEWVKGVAALDILGKRGVKKEESITKYRYGGPLAERNFCKAMQRLRKLYTYEELQEMGRRVGNGMPVYGRAEMNIINWKGGPNCQHYWEELEVFRNEGRTTMMLSRGPASGQMGRTPQDSTNNGYKNPRGQFSMEFQFADEEKQIIIGPSMIPQQLIPRRDALGNIFHVYFTKDTIRRIAEKFLKENKQNNTDLEHDGDISNSNTLLESWIVDNPDFDKSKEYGFNVPKGTWMVSYKINDANTWQRIKDGELKGFSIAGNFVEKAIDKK